MLYVFFSVPSTYGGSYLPVSEAGTVCSETSVYKIQTPRNFPEENIEHSEHDCSLKSRVTPLSYKQKKHDIASAEYILGGIHWLLRGPR